MNTTRKHIPLTQYKQPNQIGVLKHLLTHKFGHISCQLRLLLWRFKHAHHICSDLRVHAEQNSRLWSGLLSGLLLLTTWWFLWTIKFTCKLCHCAHSTVIHLCAVCPLFNA